MRVHNSLGELQTVRVLLDSSSQVSAITSECVTRLRLRRTKSRIEVTGLSQHSVTEVKGVTQCKFIPFHAKGPQLCALNVIILTQITTQLPSDKLPTAVRDRYQYLLLADPEFDVPGSIDMLIGGDLYLFTLCSQSEVIHTPGLPSALKTQLGWLILGTLNDSIDAPIISLSISTKPTIENLMYQFWAIEEPDLTVGPTSESEVCKHWFLETVKRDETGRFSVALPFKSTISTFKDNSESPKDLNRQVYPSDLGSSRSC